MCKGRGPSINHTAEFLRLAERNALNESESQQVARYMEGLKPTIRDKIGVQMVETVDDARSLALKAEMMTQDRGNSYRRNYAESSQVSAERSQATKQPGLNKQGQGNFDKSAGKKLVTETGASRNQNSLVVQFTAKCFKCNQPGHRSSDCPRRKAIALVEHEEDVEDVFCDPEEEEEYSVDDDYEQTYMVRKLMLAPKQEDQSQRNKLFRTRCNIHSRTFNLIIDSGSQENIIGRAVVEKARVAS